MSRHVPRFEHFLLFLAVATTSACQDATAPTLTAARQFNTSVEPAACDINSDSCDFSDTAGSYVFILDSFDSNALVITGVSRDGAIVNAQFTTATVFRPANLNMLPPNPVLPTDPFGPSPPPILPNDPWFPNDPMREYNEALALGLGDTFTIYNAISNLAAARVPARLWLDQQTRVVRAFRPIN